MNREIKFRAWIPSERFMGVPFNPFDDDEEVEVDGVVKTVAFPNDAVFMQFTGLTDKNGKEIYEGDIIQCGGENEPMVVAWSDKYASFGIHRSGWMYMHFFGEAVDNTDCEVIGDIYRNPELIKQLSK
jgi:uncharacterized phage protein (TIGR01671 family)